MSLLKIPLILSACSWYQSCCKPPNLQLEGSLESVAGDYVAYFVASTLWFPKLFLGAVEVIAILSDYAPIFSSFVAPLHLKSAQHININASSLRITPVYLLGWALIHIGWRIRTSAFEELGTQFTYKLRVSEKHRLVTTGSYSRIRHPSYSGALLFIFGGILTQMGPGSLWAIFPTSFTLSLVIKWWVGFSFAALWYTVVRAHGEEKMMEEGFGKEWLVYTANTPYMFIPYIL